jgi:stage II sporulation protein D
MRWGLAAGAALLLSPGAALRRSAEQIVVKGPREVRVVLESSPNDAELGGMPSLRWRLVDAWGRVRVDDNGAGESPPRSWRMERRGRRLRGVSPDRRNTTAWSDEPFSVLPADPGGLVGWRGRRYRGELRYVATDTAILVINVLALEDYLRGVVPLEIGPRTASDAAAVEAQAVASRSFTVARSLDAVIRPYDLIARAADQVYGGADAETPVSDAAVRATTGQVLTFAGRIIRAPYHSTCGGSTAEPSEVWTGGTEAYLKRVIDLDSQGQPWCAGSPRFRWERNVARDRLAQLVAQHLRLERPPFIRAVRAESRSESGRVRTLAFETEGATLRLQGNDMRFALRDETGAILNSTDFTVASYDERGLMLRGRGNGHGVGMCQWGAIGRARAGHTALQILSAYYPATEVARLQ